MCSVIILRRPGHAWPLLLAANRDEMTDRLWQPPARHWSDRPGVVAGKDHLAGGTWLGLNDYGVIAGVLNRRGALGPQPGLRSRGELPLEALDHADAQTAVEALADIDNDSYRSFNMVVADRRDAFWLSSARGEAGRAEGLPVRVEALPPGLSMITSRDRNDPSSARVRNYRPRFEAAPAPNPGSGAWSAWTSLLASRVYDADAGPDAAMTVVTDWGFGTVSSSLIALPGPGGAARAPVWLFAAGRPGEASYEPVVR